MAVQRVLPNEDRLRRVAGLMLMIPGLSITWLSFGLVTSPGGTRAFASAAILLLGGAALTAAGGRLAFLPRVVLEIDVESRRYAVRQRGAQAESGPLDALGPLVVSMRTRSTGKRGSYVTEYLVVPSPYPMIDVYCGKSASKARLRMEILAKAWGLSTQSLGGAVRKANELDVPLYERLRSDSAASKPMEIPPGCPVRIDVLPAGYALISTGRDPTSMWAGLIFLGIGLYPLLASHPLERWTGLADSDPSQSIVTVLLTGLAIVMTLVAARCFRDVFLPGSIMITTHGVSYRGRRMRFSDIEEVTTNPVEIIGDRKSMVLPDAFCPPKDRNAVAHEIRRLISEVGSRTP